jgi:hypothetical protein
MMVMFSVIGQVRPSYRLCAQNTFRNAVLQGTNLGQWSSLPHIKKSLLSAKNLMPELVLSNKVRYLFAPAALL